ncbi:hypothetical protein SAMN05443572_11336 [Myxococcus fulvus]|uniref:Knr4/Smi1-like domain-containing protein n=1 Tax=Myxococcus fulvus TaxID=33 RepID=A0A511TFS4_MYXFU|nr:hypothetical protein [Myxococcus fulvus]AKF85141.1 hypothetical protein MFUL124B02_09900 [Myxococcus fulvus 124B02]GEN13001.1 hypothetical protein MFU01_80380 [Myxococcus fulvus]SEU38371.1 hypothetical protein SAMN05443572_11336 [Myxococcus fulvus]
MDEETQAHYRRLLAEVEAWAKGFGGRLVLGPPVSEEDLALLPELLGTSATSVAPLPSGLLDFWRLCGFARVEVLRAEDDAEPVWTALPANFRVYSPDEVMASLSQVRIPAGVTRDRHPITTEHLIPFAAANRLPQDVQWCIATSGGGLKAPVLVRNHMDELAWACFQDSGRFVWETEGQRPGAVFDSFLDWLDAYARDVRDTAPEDLYPDGVYLE